MYMFFQNIYLCKIPRDLITFSAIRLRKNILSNFTRVYKYVKIIVETYFLKIIIVIILNTQQHPPEQVSEEFYSIFPFFFSLVSFNVINTRQPLISGGSCTRRKTIFEVTQPLFLVKWGVSVESCGGRYVARLYSTSLRPGTWLLPYLSKPPTR